MRKQINLDLDKLVTFKKDVKSFNNEIIIVELNEPPPRHPDINVIATRLNAFSILLTRKGEIEINMNDIDYHLTANTILDLTNLDVFKDLKFSDDFMGYHVIISLPFFDEILRYEKPLTPDAYAFKRAHPIEKITPEDSDLLTIVIQRIIKSIDRKGHIWHRRMIINEARILFMEIGNIIIHSFNKSKKTPNISSLSENELLFFRFTQLLKEHCHERQPVGFYADKLCISSGYFSKVIKRFSGKTANDWITDTLLREAKSCLRNPKLTIQQSADILNFSDQSAFGKFFKNKTSISPQRYRKEL